MTPTQMTATEFRVALARLGLRHGQFAREIGRTSATVGRWANGKRPVPLLVAAELDRRLAVLGVLVVETTLDGHTARQSFATVESRDDYIARARRAGATVTIAALDGAAKEE